MRKQQLLGWMLFCQLLLLRSQQVNFFLGKMTWKCHFFTEKTGVTHLSLCEFESMQLHFGWQWGNVTHQELKESWFHQQTCVATQRYVLHLRQVLYMYLNQRRGSSLGIKSKFSFLPVPAKSSKCSQRTASVSHSKWICNTDLLL